MSRALNATGRPILYSMCNWGEDQPWNFATVSNDQSSNSNVADGDYLWNKTIANSWRMSGDISDVSIFIRPSLA
jgi:alpha-galactosidase